MRPAIVILVSLWSAVYTGSLAREMWRQKNYRGGVGAAILALATLVIPGLIQVYVQLR